MSEPIRVILADDHAVVRAGIRQFLEHAVFESEFDVKIDMAATAFARSESPFIVELL